MKSLSKLLLVAVLLGGSGYTFAKPNPTVKIRAFDTVDRHLSGFNGVQIAGPFDVHITRALSNR